MGQKNSVTVRIEASQTLSYVKKEENITTIGVTPEQTEKLVAWFSGAHKTCELECGGVKVVFDSSGSGDLVPFYV